MAVFVLQVLEALQLAHNHAPELAFSPIKGGLTEAVLPANLNQRLALALALLVQNSQNLGLAKATFFGCLTILMEEPERQLTQEVCCLKSSCLRCEYFPKTVFSIKIVRQPFFS